MYVHIENGSIDYKGSLPKNWRNISGLNLSEGDHTFLKPLGWLPATETKINLMYNEVYDENQIIINSDDIQIIQRARSMTTSEKNERDKIHLERMRDERNEKLRVTDFYALSDVTMLEEMETYRQSLRDFPETCDMTQWGIEEWPDITWPIKPE